MTAYAILNYTVHDAEMMAEYLRLTMPTLAPYSAKVIVAGDSHTVLEGAPGKTIVIIEFPTRKQANEWYNSEVYQAAIPATHGFVRWLGDYGGCVHVTYLIDLR